jgi:chemotaxis protein methyltransferase CheR
MNPLLLQNFIDLIANRTGIRVRDKDQAELIKKIRMRMIALKFSTPETYYHYLTPQPIQDRTDAIQKSSAKEWDSLTLLLTTGETYFFRDQGQLNLIREVILPEIIARKQQAQAISKTKPSLRIWSAGSSTGEEPYSLAIMVKELIPNYFNWDILILGTDINVASITKAKVGQFSEWSFRSVKPEIKNQYFSPINQDWILKEDIRQMVTLHTSNLLIEDYPNFNKNIYNMDIIICRNVFIYFDTSTIKTILDKFYETLSTSGYLMVGHTELHGIDTQGFVPQSHQESVIYQRSKDLPVNLSISRVVSF